MAAESAAALGVRHVIRTVSATELAQALPLIVWYLDDPVADPALVPLWFIAWEAREQVKVVLSGEGADELFSGYTIYREPLSLAAFERVPGGLRRTLGRISAQIPGRAGQGPAASGRVDVGTALLRQRTDLPRRSAARGAPRFTTRVRIAPGTARYRACARAEPAQTGFSGADRHWLCNELHDWAAASSTTRAPQNSST